MSDDRTGPQTTLEMPPVPPGGAPPSSGPTGSSGGVPVWLVAVIAIASVLVTALAAYGVVRRSTDAARVRITRLEAENADLATEVGGLRSALTSATAAADAAAATAEESPAPGAAATVRQLCLITKITGSAASGYEITADYVQMLTGDAAAAAATAHGDESPPPNDYYLVNENTKLRTFALDPDATVLVLDWGGNTGTDSAKIGVAQFVDVMHGGPSPKDPWQDAYYWITVQGDSRVTTVEQQYFP